MANFKTTNIQGKNYVTVNERLKYFRVNYPNYSLQSTIIEQSEERCVIKAVVKNGNGVIVAEGIACEMRDQARSMVNKTSHIENCETSAWGRALGSLGIGIDESIATADEVVMAIEAQKGKGEDPLMETGEPSYKKKTQDLTDKPSEDENPETAQNRIENRDTENRLDNQIEKEEKATPEQVKKINIKFTELFKEMEVSKELHREVKIHIVSFLSGQPIMSTKDVFKHKASKILDFFEDQKKRDNIKVGVEQYIENAGKQMENK